MRLTEHFTLEELTHSDTALRLGIDNHPVDAQTLDNLTLLARHLETVRAALGAPLHITSGYRCPLLNKAVGGSATSAHMSGLAADFRAPEFGTPLAICQHLAGPKRSLPFEQLIQEGRWVHFAVAPWPSEGKREILTAHFTNGKATYSPGLA